MDSILKNTKIIHGSPDIANIAIDKYDEIFSDFDPSPYQIRTVSDDFINEAKKICREKDDVLKEFNIFLLANARDEAKEILIIKRVHTYFKKKLLWHNLERKQIKRKGMFYGLGGIILLVTLTYFLSLQILPSVLQVAFIVIEPAGWFLIWMGLDYVFF
jgi:hypothetical protein